MFIIIFIIIIIFFGNYDIMSHSRLVVSVISCDLIGLLQGLMRKFRDATTAISLSYSHSNLHGPITHLGMQIAKRCDSKVDASHKMITFKIIILSMY